MITKFRMSVRQILEWLWRSLAVVAGVALAFLIREPIAHLRPGFVPFITFYPAVLLAALLGGLWSGILATVLCALVAAIWIFPPAGQLAIRDPYDVLSLAVFLVFGIALSIVLEFYRRNREKLAAYRVEDAIFNERRKAEEERQKAESAWAERERLLDMLETLRATRNPAAPSVAVPIGRDLSRAEKESSLSSLDRKQFRALLRRTVLVPFTAALILGGAALWAAYELNASLQWVDRTDQVISQSRRLLRLTVDMESGERGYLVTGNDEFLLPYREASQVLDSEYLKLYLLVADDPPQQARLEKLHDNLHHWQGYAEQMIALRRAGGAYSDLGSNQAGKAEVDEIRDEIGGFQSVEEHLRDEAIRTAHRDWVLVATVCILLGLLVGSGLVVFTFRRMEMIAASFEQSGQALKESERRWATTLASIGDAVIAADCDGRITFLNPVAAALTGWQSEDALDQPIHSVFNIVNEQTRAPAEDIVNRVLTEGRIFELANHTALLAKDGREIPIVDSAAPILGSDGKIAGLVLVFHDVTEHRRAEKIIATTLQRFYAILSNLNSGILLVTNEGRIEFANQAFCDLFRLKESPADLVATFDSEKVIARIDTAYENPEQAILRVRELVKQGQPALSEEVPIQNGCLFMRDFVPLTVDGKLYGRMWVHTDVTDLKRGEDALRESRAKLEAALASMTDSVIITDAEGRFLEFNDAFATFYRFKNKAECARSFAEFVSIFDVSMANGEPAPQEMYAIQRALRGEAATAVEYRLRRKDTGESWVGAISFSPIRNNDGAIIGSVVTARDITEAKRAGEERQIAVDFLEMVNQSRSTRDLIERATAFFQERSGCEAVGVRLRDGEDYPYFEARGFSKDFVQLETRLSVRAASGEAVRDSAGKPVLECLCGNVIRGRFETSKPFYTAHGSFWSNSTTELVAGAAEGDLPSSARHRCNRAGYESVGLFPMYVGEERFGLLQLNDRRKGRFSPQTVALWERLAGQLATAVSKFQAEEALRESEQQFRNLANAIPQLCWMANADGWLFWYNQRWYEYTGTTPEQMEGWGWQSVHDPDALPLIMERWKDSIATGKPFDMEFPLRGADGVFRPFLTRVMPVKDAEGKVVRWFGTNTDITERKRSEEALRESEKRLRLAVDAGSMATWDLDIASSSTNWNDEMFLLLGYEPDSTPASYEAWKRRVLPEDLSKAETALRHSLEYGGDLRSEYRVQSGDDKVCWVEARGRCDRDSNGNAIRSFGVMMDITERKQAEEHLNKLNRTLRALSNSNQALMRAEDESAYLNEVCRIVTDDCGHAMVWIGFAEHDECKTVRAVAHGGFDNGYLETLGITWGDDERGQGPTGTAIRTGQPAMCPDTRADPAFAPWRDEAVKRGYASSLVMPLKGRGEAWGAITIYSRETNAFTEAEVKLLTELAGDLEFGIDLLRARAANARTAENLRESEARYRTLFSSMNEGFCIIEVLFDADGKPDDFRYLEVNDAFEKQTGLHDAVGKRVGELIPDIEALWFENYGRTALTGEPARFMSELKALNRVYDIHAYRVGEPEMRRVAVVFNDFSAYKRAEEELRRNEKLALQGEQLHALAVRQQRAREEERTRVSRDLHDQIGQILTAIKMDMTWMGRRLAKTQGPVRERLAGTVELINDGIRSVRRICTGLRPGVLDDLGLAAAIEWQANEFASRTGIPCQVSATSGDLHLDGEQATAFFRIFQECLTNVSRHAKARSVRVSLHMEGGNLLMVVRDDGKGFRESEASGSLGILGMKERAQVCGGDLQISSSPGNGTTVTLCVPIRSAGENGSDHAHSDSR